MSRSARGSCFNARLTPAGWVLFHQRENLRRTAESRWYPHNVPNAVKDALSSGRLAGVRAAIRADPKAARHPSVMCHAAGMAFQDALELLVKNGGDLNA